MIRKISEKNKEKEKKKTSQEEFEEKILELARKGLTSEKIGEALRKQGIHPKEHKKKISAILKKDNLYENSDLKNVEIKFENLKKHCEKNKQDKRAIREKNRIFAQIRKLKKYFGILKR